MMCVCDVCIVCVCVCARVWCVCWQNPISCYYVSLTVNSAILCPFPSLFFYRPSCAVDTNGYGMYKTTSVVCEFQPHNYETHSFSGRPKVARLHFSHVYDCCPVRAFLTVLAHADSLCCCMLGMRLSVLSHALSHMHTHTLTYPHSHMHTTTCAHSHSHICTQSHMHPYTYSLRIRIFAILWHTHTCTCTHTNTHLHMHTHVHTHTHTHTHTFHLEC